MKDRNYLINMYNATSANDGNGEIETYEKWLERQLISRIERLEQLDLANVRLSLPSHKDSVMACDESKFDTTSEDKESWNAGKVAGWNECYNWMSIQIIGNEA